MIDGQWVRTCALPGRLWQQSLQYALSEQALRT
jgi:hypothetical protein